ncbi:hypothetical protein K9O30_06145 [Clostridium bowmanii]|uniref:hypothetical protein n=1 Tax=Clostridium bowmanii TaxID=132925 RepID=UPI001C0CAAE7|nr:hypothetical protein [Clostridium bowmanii]MBU3188741.1 hypothetical protein [Clostridium bowmanii]MCA1073326.1 hypothetical protein [Clostridium bowmanii]
MKTQLKKCFACNSIIVKDIVALNKKVLGRNIEKFFCLACLADYLEITPDELLESIQQFKEQGCSLFK